VSGTPAASRVAELRRELHQRLVQALDYGAAEKLERGVLVSSCEARARALAQDLGRDLAEDERERLVAGVLDDMFRLGPLEPLLADDEVSDILVSGPRKVHVERRGVLEPASVEFRDEAHLLHVVQRIVRNAGRRIDEKSPMVDARLPDGSRVNAIIPPLAVDGPQLSIRRFPKRALTLERLVELGALAPASAALLRAAVRGRLNIIFAGGAGVGKTTLLNAASASLGPRERIVTIEDAAELRLEGEQVVRLETRAANIEGVGETTTRDLVRNALRMRPDRILVGECRGGEAFDMMQAMNTGHEGSMTTLHANSARDALVRLESMLAMGGFDMPVGVLRGYIASAIHLVVHLVRLPDGRRVVGEIVEVLDVDEHGVRVEPLHRHRLLSVRDGKAQGRFEATGAEPTFLEHLGVRGIELDRRLFAAGPVPGGARA
jgi:pilus assembly protein CpaF